MVACAHMQEVQSIEEVLKERSQVDELRAQLQQEQQASRAKDQQLQAHIDQTATEMQVCTDCLLQELAISGQSKLWTVFDTALPLNRRRSRSSCKSCRQTSTARTSS
jgi:hypothetical protein